MPTFSNLLTGSDEQSAGLEYLPNSRTMGPVKVVAGRYYLVPFSLKTDLQIMPVLMSINSENGLSLALIGKTVINTTIELSPYNIVHKSIGFYLYAGYCTESNSNWSSMITFGRSGYSSFAYSIDEAQGLLSSPISKTIVANDNSATIAVNPNSTTYIVGMSMVPNIYPMVMDQSWTKLSDCFDESIVPNFLTGYSAIGLGTNPSWTISTSSGQPGPYLEKALIACALDS